MFTELKLYIKDYLQHRKLNKAKEEFISKRGFDIKCSNCQTWLSQSSNPNGYEHEQIELDDSNRGYTACNGVMDTFVCPDCDYLMRFRFDIAPVALGCDEKGIPKYS